MEKQLKCVILSCLLVGGFGCAKGGGGGDGATGPAKLGDKASGALAGQTALFEASRRAASAPGAMPISSQSVAMLSQLAAAGAVAPSGKAQVEAKTKQAQQMINPSVCKISPVFKRQEGSELKGANAAFAPMDLKISGAGCPVEIDMKMETSAPICEEATESHLCKFKVEVKMAYQVRDDKLAGQLGVRSGHLNMSFDMAQSNMSPSRPEGKMSMIMKNKVLIDMKAVDLDGHANLLTGNLDIDMKEDIEFGKMGPSSQQPPEIKISLIGAARESLRLVLEATGETTTMTAEVVASGATPTEKYFINGNAVTSEQYNEEHSKFANSLLAAGMGNSQSPSADPASPPSPGPEPTPPPPQRTNPVPPPPGDTRWACLTENLSSRQPFIGYGAIEFAARSRAQEACSAVAGTNCGTAVACEQQEGNPQAWFCETRNFSTNRRFNGTGASKIEATFNASNDCFVSSGSYSSACLRNLTCEHQ